FSAWRSRMGDDSLRAPFSAEVPMNVFQRRSSVSLLAGLTVLALSVPTAQARRTINPINAQNAANMLRVTRPFYLPSGIRLQQAAFNTAVLGRALANLPPQAFGYNPVINPIPPAAFARPGFPSSVLAVTPGINP